MCIQCDSTPTKGGHSYRTGTGVSALWGLGARTSLFMVPLDATTVLVRRANGGGAVSGPCPARGAFGHSGAFAGQGCAGCDEQHAYLMEKHVGTPAPDETAALRARIAELDALRVAVGTLIDANDEARGIDRPRPDIAWRDVKRAYADCTRKAEGT